MELKTKVHAEDGKQEILITREFDLPVALLFKAHVEPNIFEQWMSHQYGTTQVTKFESKKHGSWRFQTTDAHGTVLFAANGVFHEFVPNQKITRTFEAENGFWMSSLNSYTLKNSQMIGVISAFTRYLNLWK